MKYLYLFAFIFFMQKIEAQPAQIIFDDTLTGQSGVTDIVFDNTNRMYLVKQAGTIEIVNGTSVLPTPFLNISGTISNGGERGLLSMAFHPDYANNGVFFVYYTAASPVGNITVARYQRSAGNPDVADASTGTVLFSLSKGPSNPSNHNGGKLNFDADGNLYFGTGDGGGGGDPNNHAQTGTVNLGKMIRINVSNLASSTYTIPAANPYIADANVNDEILALGLRNPWRWSFDKLTGDMWIADVGQGAWEEVNFRAAADINNPGNYGWKCFEGTSAYGSGCSQTPANLINPVFQYDHSSAGGISITGGYVYRGTAYTEMQGYYICGDYNSGNGWLVKNNGGGSFTNTAYTAWPTALRTFGEDNNGEIYAAAGSTVYRVRTNTVAPVKLVNFGGNLQNNNAIIDWSVKMETAGDTYILEGANASMIFNEVYRTKATENRDVNNYTYTVLNSINKYYRLKMQNADGSTLYSPVINLDKRIRDIKVMPTKEGIVIQSNVIIRTAEIMDMSGRRILTKTINNSGYADITFNGITGIYFVRLIDDKGAVETFKILK